MGKTLSELGILHYAIKYQHFDLIQQLLVTEREKFKLDVNFAFKKGKTPLHYLTKYADPIEGNCDIKIAQVNQLFCLFLCLFFSLKEEKKISFGNPQLSLCLSDLILFEFCEDVLFKSKNQTLQNKSVSKS
jgi:hypothetical protein